MTTPTSPETLDALLAQWSGAMAELHPDDVDMGWQLLDAVKSVSDVEVQVRETASCEWQLGVCLADRVGTLSLVSGLLTSHGLDIIQADTFTVVHTVSTPTFTGTSRRRLRRHANGQAVRRRPRSASYRQTPTPWAVMLFDVRSRSGQPPDWDALKNDIARNGQQSASGNFDAARLEVIERFSHTMMASENWTTGKLPVDITTDNEGSDDHSLLEITSGDTPGFLFAFSTALSSVRVNVVRARIRTDGDTVRDTFWLTEPSGKKIESERRLEQISAAAALIKQFTHLLPTAPDPGQALRQFNLLMSQLLSRSDWTAELEDLESPGVLETLAEMMGTSRFLWEQFLRVQHENLFPVLLDRPGLYASCSRSVLTDSIESLMAERSSHAERVRALNDFKDRQMFRIDLRYITGRIDRRQFGAEMSTLAEVVVEQAFGLGIDSTRAQFGTPRLEDGSECEWAVLALGKFGGSDMGFGSDLELIFVYEAEGTTDGPVPARASTFFNEVVREFLQALETRQHGVFEVDMRLRPYGSKGALASSLAAVEDYYTGSGDARQFERLALVRMRPVAGHARLGERVMQVRDSFVYSSEPLDIENIRHLRRRQASELVERGSVNAKISSGGMVDIEYYVQAWQIACGVEDPSVRQTNTLSALEALRAGGHVDGELAGRIGESYRFFLALVDALRVVRGNASDLNIPAQDSRDFHHLAHRLGIETTRSFWSHHRTSSPHGRLAQLVGEGCGMSYVSLPDCTNPRLTNQRPRRKSHRKRNIRVLGNQPAPYSVTDRFRLRDHFVLVERQDAAVPHDPRAVDHEVGYVSRLCLVYEHRHDSQRRHKVRPSEVDHEQVGLLADFQAADLVAYPQRPRAPDRRPVEHVLRLRPHLVVPPDALVEQRRPDHLHHVLGHVVRSHPDWTPGGAQFERRSSRATPRCNRGIVGDRHAVLAQQRDLRVVHVPAVRDHQPVAQEVVGEQVLRRPDAARPHYTFHLQRALGEVNGVPQAVLFRQLERAPK